MGLTRPGVEPSVMTSIFVAFFVSLFVATGLTPLVLKLATRRGLYDLPDGRKVHSRLIPRLGGLAIVIAFFTPITGLLLVDAGLTQQLTQSQTQLTGLFIGGFLVAALGLYDDLRSTNARQKFAVQILVALIMWALDYRIENISNPLGAGYLELGVLSLPVTVLWFVGVMNAVNLIDGLDGLAGGIGLISVSTLMALALMDGNVLAALMCACLAGSLIGFLFFNFNPARIFMGDTGSLFLGFVLAAFSISTSAKGSTALALSVPLMVLAVPIFDTMLAIGRRIRARRNIFSADQEHIHHKLLKAGFSHRGAVLTLYAIAATLAALAVLVRTISQPAGALVMLAAGLLLFVLLRVLANRHEPVRALSDPFGDDGLRARAAFDAVADRLLVARTTADVSRELDQLATATRCLSVVLTDRGESRYVFDRAPNSHESQRVLGSYHIPLSDRDNSRAHVELRFARDLNADKLADLVIVLPWERVRPALAAAMERLSWATLQSPVPAIPIPPRPPVQVPAIDPLPAWTRATPRPKGA